MTILKTKIWGEMHTVEMDTTDEESRVIFCGKITEYRTANFQRNIYDVMRAHLNDAASYGCSYDEIQYGIDEAIENAVIVEDDKFEK